MIKMGIYTAEGIQRMFSDVESYELREDGWLVLTVEEGTVFFNVDDIAYFVVTED